jgi:hypothetical protein
MNGPINVLIPADELHWNEYEEKYSVVSTEEMDRIVKLCLEADMEDEDIFMVLKDYAVAKTGHLLYKHLLEGDIVIGGLDDSGKPIFRRRPENGNK